MLFHEPVFPAPSCHATSLSQTKGHGSGPCVAAVRKGGGKLVVGEMGLGRIDLHKISTWMSHAYPPLLTSLGLFPANTNMQTNTPCHSFE